MANAKTMPMDPQDALQRDILTVKDAVTKPVAVCGEKGRQPEYQVTWYQVPYQVPGTTTRYLVRQYDTVAQSGALRVRATPEN
jgi:hypothetical protein